MFDGRPPRVNVARHATTSACRGIAPSLSFPSERLTPSNEIAYGAIELVRIKRVLRRALEFDLRVRNQLGLSHECLSVVSKHSEQPSDAQVEIVIRFHLNGG